MTIEHDPAGSEPKDFQRVPEGYDEGRASAFHPPGRMRRSCCKEFERGSMTEQHHADRVNIQNIMERWQKTGVLDHVNNYKGTYGDFISEPDFYQAQLLVAEAKSMFATLPSSIRERFANDPGRYLAFMNDVNNINAIKELGLDASHLEATAQGASAIAEGTPDPVEDPTVVPGEPAPDPSPSP